ncbi:MAG TPA: sulfotransferase [Mycobacteriales bacterium]|nr:sulfotransferase [Mycobacteriales bacterium]
MSTTVQHGRAIRTINAVGGGLHLAPKLSSQSLMDAAAKRTGLRDFGDEGFRTGLDVLVGSLEEEAQLTFLGRVAAKSRLTSLLEQRLRLIDAKPLYAGEQVARPVFVLGLPRTGTTVLYGMLAANPALRSPSSWEVSRPFPAPLGEDPERVQASQKDLDGFRRLAPGIDQIHPMGPDLPQECLAMQAPSFSSYEFVTTFPVPSYWEWLRGQDMAPAYAFEKQFLQHLQSGGQRGEHWVLKTPCHLMWLDALLEVFPDALLVHTHRDPTTVLASVSSLMSTIRSAVSNHVDPVAIGREQLAAWTWGMQRVMEVRDRLPADRVVDVRFEDTVAQPVETVEKVYAHLGLDYTPAVAEGVRDYLAANPRDKHGTHTYTLSEFGLEHDEVEAAFATYNERFGS